ncbi:serpentine type 7TM GPCR chemoreceptor srt domain-containing protein [Ditylenchus destructor]|nr:serpentine type 7TM GPCR chemoreceptor srt domain-containing protein [Ditylenchus destructor]
MFVLGVCDVGATLIGGTFAGIFAIRGDIFCTNQTVMYLVGCVEQPIWGACCVTGLILLLNRAVNLIDEKYAHALFGKSKIYIWLMIPFGVFFHCYFFTTPLLIQFNIWRRIPESIYGSARDSRRFF